MVDPGNLAQKAKTVRLADNVDYLKLFYALKSRHKYSYLFESLVMPKQQDRYFTIGFDPMYVFSAKGNQFTARSKTGEQSTKVENPYRHLKKLMPKMLGTNPYFGGLVGYFSYESANYFEPALDLAEHPDFDQFELGLYVDGLVYDNETAELTYYTYHQDRSGEIKRLIKELPSVTSADKLEAVEADEPKISRSRFIEIVKQTLEDIKAGKSFQVEVGISKNYRIAGDKFAIYQKLRQINPSPYMYYLSHGPRQLFGASPEIVVALKDGRILTTPAAGTIERGETETADKQNVRKLANDPKEIAEHNMLVDLHRNDISRVAKIGSVRIDRLRHIMKFKYVSHMVSDIVGEIKGDKNSFDLLAGIMPCGVLTGAPKIETMRIIRRNENSPRGPYGGAVGRFSFNGDCVFAMPIRSLFFNGNNGFNQACAGIVFDSDPKKEYQEVIAKLAGIEESIKGASP